jgi:hypothetical protein
MVKKGTKRRKSLPTVEEARAKCHASACTLLDNQHSIVMATITEHLNKNFSQAVRVMIMLQNGELDEKEAPKGAGQVRRFTSQNKMRLVKVDIMMEVFMQLGLPERWVHRLQGMSKEQVSNIFAVVQNVELGCAVWSKCVDRFVTTCVARYQVSGKALHTAWAMDSTTSDELADSILAGIGFFKIIKPRTGKGVGDESITIIQHISGKRAEMPEEMRHNEWELKDNMNFHRATLKNGLTSVLAKEIFSSQGVALEAPAHLKEVPQAAQDSDVKPGASEDSVPTGPAPPSTGDGGALSH